MIARADALAAMQSDEFDVVVIGGGITGAGVALDAASRGYSVALVEKNDYSSGTSSRSSKLVHGGLRYLQNFDLGLVREALVERQLMVNLAPHLVRPLPLLIPAFDGKRPDRKSGVGLNLYDVMSHERRSARRRGTDRDPDYWSPERHRTVDAEETVELLPALAGREPTSAYLFYDCQTDDTRLVFTVLGEAERFGAVCANSVQVEGLVERDGRATGVLCRDTLGGGEFELCAENVVNATGVWADRIRPDELHDEAEVPRIKPSRGTHVTVALDKLPVVSGAIVPAGGGRFIFVLPWLGRTLIGTTDVTYDSDELDHIPPGDEDVQYLLDAVNEFFATSLTATDLSGAYAGVRPLISTGDPKKSVDISRKDELYETSSGMITITGGKLTTWRHMAQRTVDRIVEREGREAPCRTTEIPLGMPLAPGALDAYGDVDDAVRDHLAARYGHAAVDVMRMADDRPHLARRIVPDLPDLLVEAPFAARREQARSLEDVLLRRTRLGLLDARTLCAPGSPEARDVAEAMAEELGWNAGRVETELELWGRAAALEGLVPGQDAPEPA
ncbi:MAG TPA: glycerol-3-phosphate dehydrogenase/oxidase [Thermoleophilaceae bacterium]|nr:glycerol-3-phosphate dehydrogenase/oxidase [Thermoleophilaceae bacterium]